VRKYNFDYLFIATLLLQVLPASAMATVINTLEPVYVLGSGLWSVVPPNAPVLPGTVEITDVTGAGGNLENNAPLGTGALKLTTTGGGDRKAEARIDGNFGTVEQFIDSGTFSYDYYHDSSGPIDTVAPAFKFEVLDFSPPGGTSDNFATFIFEPVYNGILAFDDWTNVSFTSASANFWHTTIYDINGLIFDNTFGDWNAAFNGPPYGFADSFLNANIFSITLGLGSGTPGETGYVDNVNFSNGVTTLMADFETLQVAAVPLPAALPLYGTGIMLLGLLGWRKRRRN